MGLLSGMAWPLFLTRRADHLLGVLALQVQDPIHGRNLAILSFLFSAVMKADKQLLKSELDYVKQFLQRQFETNDVKDFMILLKDILKQDYPLRDVCRQIQRSMDQ